MACYAVVPSLVTVARSLVAAVLLVAAAGLPARAGPTGAALPGLDPYDELMSTLLRTWDVPGAGLALARDGKLLLVRGYGLANRERRIPVEPASLFRIGSLSKTVTAVAVLQLVRDGKLSLDDKLVPILGDLGPRPGKVVDPRVHDITVRHLLQHSGGFDRQRSGDLVFMPRAVDAARRQGGSLPPDCPTVMRDALEHKLDFAPGTRIAYSNVGYCMLGRVVERVAGRPYEAYVSARILAPAGAARMRIGRTLVSAEGEVTYYDYEVKPVKALPGLGLTTATRPYGEFAMETMDSYGGWIAAPVDYLRFLLAIDGRHGTALLDAATLTQMNAPSGLSETTAGVDEGNAGVGNSYGLGIRIRPVKAGFNLWHGGSLPGTNALAVRTADGFAWVVVFNSRPKDRAAFRQAVDRGLWTAKQRVTAWPDGDLFTARP